MEGTKKMSKDKVKANGTKAAESSKKSRCKCKEKRRLGGRKGKKNLVHVRNAASAHHQNTLSTDQDIKTERQTGTKQK